MVNEQDRSIGEVGFLDPVGVEELAELFGALGEEVEHDVLGVELGSGNGLP